MELLIHRLKFVAVLSCRGYYRLRQLRPTVKSLPVDASKTLIRVFISNRLDYCNAALCGITDTLLKNLQTVQNARGLNGKGGEKRYGEGRGKTGKEREGEERGGWVEMKGTRERKGGERREREKNPLSKCLRTGPVTDSGCELLLVVIESQLNAYILCVFLNVFIKVKKKFLCFRIHKSTFLTSMVYVLVLDNYFVYETAIAKEVL